MSAPRDERADAYLHGLLSPRQTREFEQDLADDPALQRALELARRRRALLEAALPPVEANERLVRTTLERVERQVCIRRRWRRRVYAMLIAPLAACLLLVTFVHTHYSQLAANPVNLEVYGQHTLLPGSEGALRVRLTDQRTRTPLVGVPVEVTLGEPGSERFVSLATFTTDERGNGQPAFRLPDWADGTYPLRVTAQTPRQPEVLTRTVSLKRSARLMLTSDKPRYQPGQTIHLRSLILRRPDLRPIADADVTFTISDPKGNIIFRRIDRTSRFGIAAVDCPLADELIEGPYRIQARLGDTESSLVVDVARYVLPKVRLTLTTDQPWFEPEQPVRVTIQATYFHGEPAADADWTIEASCAHQLPPLIVRLQGRTDAKGKAVETIPLPPGLEGEVTLAAEVTDRAGQKQTAALRRTITRQPFRLDVVPENGQLVAGVPNTLYLLTTTPDGSPVPVRGSVQIDDDRHLIETGELGVGAFRLTPTAHAMSLIFDLTDPQGRRLTLPMTVALGTAHDYLVRLDRAVYTGGDTMNITILGGGTGPVFLDLLKDDQTIRSEIIDVQNGRGEFALDLPAELAGTLQLVTYRFDPRGRPMRQSRTVFVRSARELQIGLTLDKPEHRPGERARLQFTLADEQGQPVAGALSLAAVDEAVFDVKQQLPGLERTFYLLEQNLLKPAATIYPWSPDDKPGDAPQRAMLEQAIFAQTTRVDGANPFTQSPVHTLIADTYPAKAEEVARRQDEGLTFVRLAWVLIVVWLFLTIYIVAWMNLRLMILIALHLIGFLLVCGSSVVLLMLNVVARTEYKAAGVASAMEADRMAPGMMAAPGGPRDAPQDPAIRVRERFPETLLWQPQLITDAQGRATLDLEFADSITTWRLAAGAVSTDGRLGAMQRGLRVFQPFFVDLNLPVALTRGDEVEVPAVVSHFQSEPQTVELTLEQADWFDLIGDAKIRLDLQPREVRSATFRIRAKRIGRFELQVTATSAGLGDAVKRRIEIVPEGRRVERLINGTLRGSTAVSLDLPDHAIEGSGRVLVRLYPSGFSQLVEGIDGLFRLPTGCFEQTSSALYPNIMALDYLRKINRRVPEVEAKALPYIHVGAQRLLTFEVPGGGFDWYGQPPASVTLTAYGLMEFRDLARVHELDRQVIHRTRRWLLSQRAADGSWDDPQRGGSDEAAHRRLRTTAYTAWAVFDNDPTWESSITREFLLRHPADSINRAYDLALVCHALLAIDPKDEAVVPYLTRLISLRRGDDTEQVWWPLGEGTATLFHGFGSYGDVETTSLAVLALLRSDRVGPMVRAALSWIVGQRQVGHWGSTQATVLALKALLAGTGQPDAAPRRVEVRVGEQILGTIEAPADQAEVMQQLDLSAHLRPGVQEWTLYDRGGNSPGFQVEFRYHLPGAAEPDDAGPLAIEVKYDRDTMTVAEVLQAAAMITNRSEQIAPMVMLDLPIPPGFRVDPAAFDKLKQAGTIARYDVTPRQIIVYLRSLPPRRPLTFSYDLIPGSPATLTVPAARVWEYYTPSRHAESRPAAVTVR